jgi:hypothetical protein
VAGGGRRPEGGALSARLHAPAAHRNREPIAAVLGGALPDAGLVVEVASGSGEHAVYLAGRFASLEWQPSDVDPRARASIDAHRAEYPGDNLRPAIAIDASSDWAAAPALADEPVAAILNVNMIHISPWRCCLGLLDGAARLLDPGGLLYLYGPYFRDGVQTAPSNIAFDQSLRSRDPSWGVRRLEDVVAAAAKMFALDQIVEMPANNLSVLLRRA